MVVCRYLLHPLVWLLAIELKFLLLSDKSLTWKHKECNINFKTNNLLLFTCIMETSLGSMDVHLKIRSWVQYGIIDRFISGIVLVFRAGGGYILLWNQSFYKYKDIINALISKGKNQPESCSTQPTSFVKLKLVKNWTQVSLVIRFKIHLTECILESKIKIYI